MSSNNSNNNFFPSINPFVISVQFKTIKTNEESKSNSFKYKPKKK